MFTDIVGYTALMGKDSAKALELVRISKEIQKPLVEKHNGKWLKEMGDGAMAQFGSALDAVKCAVAIQKSARGELDAKLRIGIHLGDVTVEDNDVHGDGVNVASRLESIADPGGIYISDNIEKAIRGQSDIQAKLLGEINLKNVDYSVKTYALQGVGLPEPKSKKGSNKKLTRSISWSTAIILIILTSVIMWLVTSYAKLQPKKAVNNSVYSTSILTPEDVVIDLIGEATVGVGRRVIDISQQGDKIAFIGNLQSRPHVFVRNLNEFKTTPINGTEGAYACRFSPDGNEIAYFVGNSLWKIKIVDGSPLKLAEVTNPMDILWELSDLIYYSADEGGTLYKMQNFTKQLFTDEHTDFTSLSKIPETDYVIITRRGHVSAFNLATSEIIELRIKGKSAKYVPTGHLVYTRGSSLTAVAFDKEELKVLSEPTEILPGIRRETYGSAQFDFSDDGTLIFIEGESTVIGSLTWVDRNGNAELLPFPQEDYGVFKISPDETKIATPVFGTTEDIWIYDLVSTKRVRITNEGRNNNPLWIDNNTLFIRTDGDIHKININKQFTSELILENAIPETLSQNAEKLVFRRGADLFISDLETDSITNLTNTPDFFEGHGSISPDGSLVAYTSDRSNAFHVYLQHAYPDGPVIQISQREGSEEPRWTSDNKRIVYRSGQQWMEVEILDSEKLEVSRPKLLIKGDYVNISGFSFDITKDGQKLLMSKGTDVRTAKEIKIVKGWFKELEKIVPIVN